MSSGTTGVSQQQAVQWERDQHYPIPELFVLPSAVRQAVCHHFAHVRLDDWVSRLAKYWASQENKRADEQKFGNYGWIKFGESYHYSPYEDCHLGQGRPAVPFWVVLMRFVNGDPQGLQGTGVDLMAYKIRSTVAMHKRARIGTEFHGFLELPPEIRDIVYDFALSQGTVIVPSHKENANAGNRKYVKYWRDERDNTYQRYESVEEDMLALQRRNREGQPLGLIQGVSRTVHDEASRVYFGRNRFILPVGLVLRPSLFTSLASIRGVDLPVTMGRYSMEHARGRNNAVLVCDVSYAFDMRDYVSDDYTNQCYDLRIRTSVDEELLPPQDAMRALHDRKCFELEISWAERIDCIKLMTLDRLELSFDECYCSTGCCRMVGWVLDRFLHSGPPPGTADTEENVYSSEDWKDRPPLVIEILGWKTEREKILIQQKLEGLRNLLDSIEIRLGRQAGTEASELEADDQLIKDMLTEALVSPVTEGDV